MGEKFNSKPEHLRRKHRIDVSFSREELDRIHEFSYDANLKLRTYIREAALRPGKVSMKKTPEKLAKLDKEIVSQILKIGNNINQIARKLNAFSEVNHLKEDEKRAILEAKKVIAQVLEAL